MIVDVLAFRALGPLATKPLLAGTTSARIEVQTSGQLKPSLAGSRKLLVRNLGPAVAFIEPGDSSVEATVPDSNGGSQPILVNEVMAITLNVDTHLAGICADGDENAALIYATLGDGA